MANFNRRDFLRTTAGAAGALALGSPALAAAKRTATDWVPLGQSGVKVTRLAFGTGTFGGKVQRDLGQEAFTKLVRHAYDRGIRFFETADAYREMPTMLGIALKGLPRDSYRIMTKYRTREQDNPRAVIDRLRTELQTEHLDVLLLHCVRTNDWAENFKKLRDEFDEAKQKQVISAHGASCHGLIPLRTFPDNKWLDVALMRINHNGTRMDSLQGGESADIKGDVPEVTSHVAQVHKKGTGVIGMKIMGEGAFKDAETRDASIKFVMQLGTVDAVTIGFKSPAEIDEAIERIGRHLNA